MSGFSKKKRNADSLTETSDFNSELESTLFESPLKKMRSENNEEFYSSDYLFIKTVFEMEEKCDFPCSKSYIKDLKDLDYNALSEKTGYGTPEECENKLKSMISKVVKVKCLKTILSEALHLLPEKRKYNPSFSFFLQEKKDAILTEKNKLGDNCKFLQIASNLWENMSKNERAKYNLEAQDCGSETTLKSPFGFFSAQIKKRKPGISMQDMKEKWSNLNIKKKAKYIEKSAKRMMEFEKNDNLFNEIHFLDSGVKDNSQIYTNGPKKEEMVAYLEYKNVPKLSAKTVALYFYENKLEKEGKERPNNILIWATSAYKELSEKERNKWEKKFAKAKTEFENSLTEWLAKEGEIAQFIYKKINDRAKKSKAPVEKKVKKVKVSEILSNLQKEEMPVKHIKKFQNEPNTPALTAQQLFVAKERKNGVNVDEKNMAEEFTNLSKETKKFWNDKSIKRISKYKNVILEFADSLPIGHLRLYLGMRRVRFIKLFKEDIFEGKYPNSEYPIYVKLTTNTSANKRDEQDDSDDSEEETTQPEVSTSTEKTKKQLKNKKGKTKQSTQLSESKAVKKQQDSSEEKSFNVKRSFDIGRMISQNQSFSFPFSPQSDDAEASEEDASSDY